MLLSIVYGPAATLWKQVSLISTSPQKYIIIFILIRFVNLKNFKILNFALSTSKYFCRIIESSSFSLLLQLPFVQTSKRDITTQTY